MLVTASSLATILLKYYMVRSPQAQQLIDRCPLYVSKERPLRSKIFRGNKKVSDQNYYYSTFLALMFVVEGSSDC